MRDFNAGTNPSVCLEVIPFNPRHQTGFGTENIEIDNQQLLVHDTNNLNYLWEAFINGQQEDYHADLDGPMSAYFYHQLLISNPDFKEVMSKFMVVQPVLFEHLREMHAERLEELRIRQLNRERTDLRQLSVFGVVSEDKKAHRKFYLSQSFDGLVDIAESLSLPIPQETWCK